MSASKRKLNLGVVGAGVMGRNHLKILSTLSGVNLVGVADLNEAAATEAALPYQLSAFTSFRQLAERCDALVVASPTSSHFQIAEELLKSGKHLLLEKPATGSSALVQNLIQLAKQANLVFGVGMIERVNPAFVKLSRLLKGEKIIGLDLQRLSPLPTRITDTDVIMDMMFHDLDLLCSLVPLEISEVKAKGEKLRTKRFDRVLATISYVNGIIARVEASRVFTDRTRKIVVTTERVVLEADLLNKRLYQRDFSTPSPSVVAVKPIDQLTEELKAFIAAIKGRGELVCPAEEIIAPLRLAEEVTKKCS